MQEISAVRDTILNSKESHDVLYPASLKAPVILASPHSGTDYPKDFVKSSRLDYLSLRRSEDSFIDQIFSNAPKYGLPLLRARFPRAYVDPNREPFELDPSMFEDKLPDYVNTQSSRVLAGVGTIAKIVANGKNIYREKLTFAEAATRITEHYRPYHKTLSKLLSEAQGLYGGYFLIDCHSMPSVGGPKDPDAGKLRADIILGDCFGSSCSEHLMFTVHNFFTQLNYKVERNRPFAGGFSTQHYGKPNHRCHALQIEINRGLYMDETSIKPRPGMIKLQSDINKLMTMLAKIRPADLQST